MKNETIPEFVLQRHNDATISSFFRRCACSLFSSARLHVGKVRNLKFPVSLEKMLFIFCKCDTVQITPYEICVSALSGSYSSSPPAHTVHHVRCLARSKSCSGALHLDECWSHQCPECAEMFSLPVIRASCLSPRPLRPALPVGPLAQLCTNKVSAKHRMDPAPQFHFFQI